MVYLNSKEDINKIIQLNQESGKFDFLKSDVKVETIGSAAIFDEGLLISEYLNENGMVVQIGKYKWQLSDPLVECTYRRFFSYEYFSIRKKGEKKFKIRIKSQSPFLRAITSDPTYDELDKYCDYFLYHIWTDWKSIQSEQE